MPEENFNEEYVIKMLVDRADFNLKYGQFFADQSKCSKTTTERKKLDSEKKIDRRADKSQTNGIFDNKNHENKPNKTT